MGERTYGIAVALAASGMPQGANALSWMRQGFLVVPLQPSGRGKTRRYTRRNIAEFAVRRVLGEIGRHDIIPDDEYRTLVAMMAVEPVKLGVGRYRIGPYATIEIDWGQVKRLMDTVLREADHQHLAA